MHIHIYPNPQSSRSCQTFIVEIDTSETGMEPSYHSGFETNLNFLNIQNIAFYSNVNFFYDIGNRELLAEKLTLEEWCHWLEGTTYLFTIFRL